MVLKPLTMKLHESMGLPKITERSFITIGKKGYTYKQIFMKLKNLLYKAFNNIIFGVILICCPRYGS